MKRKILILGAGIYQVPLIKKARQMGLYTIVSSIKGNYPGFALADKYYHADTTDIKKIIEISKKEKIKGICTTGTDVALPAIGTVCEILDLPGISKQTGILSGNKFKMKKAFISAGVTTAGFEIATTVKDAQKAYEKLSSPVIFKAVDSSGSRGIVKVESKDKIPHACSIVFQMTQKKYFVVEEFIQGEEFGVQASVLNGKLQFILPHGDIVLTKDTPVPIGHYVPYPRIDKLRQTVTRELNSSIHALGIDSSAINADFILKDQKAYLLELGVRAGATCLPELVDIYYKMDYYRHILEISLGEKPSFKYNGKQPCANHLILSEKSGVIKKIKYDAINHPDIYDVSFDYKPGERIRRFTTGPDRIGQIIVKGQTLESMFILINKIKRRILIEMK